MPDADRPALVADTTSYLPPELLAEHEIHLVSLYVGLEGDQRRESEELADLAAFYERLRMSEEAVTTSQPSVGDFLEVYEPLVAEGRDVVSVHLSAGISGTYESALQAREQLISERKGGERIHVWDSRSAAGGMGLTLLAAAKAIERGASAEETIEKAEQARADLKMWFAVDTLDYLRRGGRIGAARAWIGSTLKIKPILTLEEEITPIERVRTRARVLDRLTDYARRRHDDGFDGWVVQYIQDSETADSLIEACKPIFGCEPVFASEIGPVIGAHAGPGLLGIGSVSRELVADPG